MYVYIYIYVYVCWRVSWWGTYSLSYMAFNGFGALRKHVPGAFEHITMIYIHNFMSFNGPLDDQRVAHQIVPNIGQTSGPLGATTRTTQ